MKGSVAMIPQINTSLLQNVTPLLVQKRLRNIQKERRQSSGDQNQSADSQQHQDPNQSDSGNGEPVYINENGISLRLVKPEELPPPTPSVALSFLNLFSALKAKRVAILRLFGSRNYERSMGGLKKNSKFRKGTMLDDLAG